MNMKHIVFSISLCLGFISLSIAQFVDYPIDASHSVVSFSVGFAGGITSIDGRFDTFEGAIGYTDVNDPSTLFVKATLAVNSINTGDKHRDEDLQGPGFFNSEAHPEITFTSKSTTVTDKGYKVSGTFSMLGKTTDIELVFTRKHEPSIVWVFGEPRIAMEGTHTIDRTEYGIPKRGWDNIVPSLGSMTLSKDVTVRLVIQGVGPSLSDLIQEKISSEGTTAAIVLYNTLEAKEVDKGTYTFGDRTILGVIMKLTRDGKSMEAIAMGEFATSKYADSFMAWYGLAMAHDTAGNTEKAIEFYEKTLVMNPKFSRAKAALDELKD
jgi:polyisoprenoid-binding protein YceI